MFKKYDQNQQLVHQKSVKSISEIIHNPSTRGFRLNI